MKESLVKLRGAIYRKRYEDQLKEIRQAFKEFEEKYSLPWWKKALRRPR